MIEALAPPLAWALTYLVHSTLLVLAVALGARWLPARALAWKEGLWKLALVGPLFSATVQVVTGLGPDTLRWQLANGQLANGQLANGRTRGSPANDRPSSSPPPAERPAFVLRDSQRSPEPGTGVQPGGPIAARAPLEPRPASQATPHPAQRPLELGTPPSPASAASPAGFAARAGEAHGATRARVPAWARSPRLWGALAAGLWGAAVGWGLSRWGRDWRRLRGTLTHRRHLAAGTARELLDGLRRRAGVRGAVHLSAAPDLAAPISLGPIGSGSRRPEICLPERALRELSPDELEAVLAHELGHAVRGDAAWLFACNAIERVLFFQPLNRLARRRWRELSECLCDDWAVALTGRRLAFARSLTEVAGWLVQGASPAPVPSMAASRSQLRQRVERLVRGEGTGGRPVRRWYTRPLGASLVAALALAGPGVASRSAPAPGRATAAAAAIPAAPAISAAPAIPAAPRVRVAPIRKGRQPEATTAPAGSAAGILLAPFDREVRMLELELSAVRAELDSLAPSRAVSERLESVERRVKRLRAQRAELARLLTALLDEGLASDDTPLR